MKKIVRVIPFIIAIFLSVVVTHAYYLQFLKLMDILLN